jgi:hypothetical protein
MVPYNSTNNQIIEDLLLQNGVEIVKKSKVTFIDYESN